ncbi:hypothetical protein APHAL10511_000414 [Amanita phalloides]|nr:hypothetical protein APHAL10511_000414 [Amanita phalloides]
MNFDTDFDDCNPAIKALLFEPSSDKATPTSRPLPVGPLGASASVHGDATSLASGSCSSPTSQLFTPVSELALLPEVYDVAQPEIQAWSFDPSLDKLTSTLPPAPLVPAPASPATSGSATLGASNASDPASPLFTPVLETVNPLEALGAVQTKFADNLPDDEVQHVETARQDASVYHAPVASLPSGLFPVRAEDIDILSRSVPSFNANTPDTTSPFVKVTDATTSTSFDLSPIPGSRLINITRKRKRSLIVRDDAPEASPPAKEEAQPTPLSAQHNTTSTRTTVPPNENSSGVSLELLDQIAARAVAATIRASPGTNVFAAKPYTKQARKAKAPRNQFSGQRPFSYNASPYTAAPEMPIAQNTGMQSNAFPAQWHPAGMPAASNPMIPAGFPQTNVYAQQAYIANAMPQAPNAWSPSLVPPGFYGPSANMNGSLRGQTLNDQPMAGQMAGNYPPQAFPASGTFRALPFPVPRNSSTVPPFNNQAFMNAQAANMRRMLSLLYSQGMATRQVQQPVTSSNQFGFTGPSFSNAQPQPQMSMQQAASASMMSMAGGNTPMVHQNWMDPSSFNPQYRGTEGLTQIHTQASSLPMQHNIVNQTPQPLSSFESLQNPPFIPSTSHGQVQTGSHLSDTTFADGAANTTEDATSRPSKRRKQSQSTSPNSDGPVEVRQPVGIRETFRCQIDGCNKMISILRNGAWSVKRALQEHSHLPECPNDELIVCHWVDEKGQRCLQQTKWANYTRHFSGHLGILIRECEFCGSLQARPSNLTRHYKSCKAFHQQDRKTQEEAWSKLNTRQDFSECEKAMAEKIRNAENRRARRRAGF